MNTTIHPKRAADLHASEVRENERAELAYAAAELLETCAEAMAGSPDNGDVRRLRNVCVDFAKAVLEHVQAEHAPGAAADTLHAAARGLVQYFRSREREDRRGDAARSDDRSSHLLRRRARPDVSDSDGARPVSTIIDRQHLARLQKLSERCACTHDRGSHGQDAPHLCEPEDGDVCQCPGFELESPKPRDTVRILDASPTERPPAFDQGLQ